MGKKVALPLVYYRRQIMVLVLCSIFLISMAAFCATEEDVTGAKGMVKTIYGLIDDVFGISGMEDLEDLLVIHFDSGTLKAGGITFTSLSTVLTTMYKTFQNLGVMLLLVFFFCLLSTYPSLQSCDSG